MTSVKNPSAEEHALYIIQQILRGINGRQGSFRPIVRQCEMLYRLAVFAAIYEERNAFPASVYIPREGV